MNTLDYFRKEIQLFETSKLFWDTKNNSVEPWWENSLQKYYVWSKLKKKNHCKCPYCKCCLLFFITYYVFVALKHRMCICVNVRLLCLSPIRMKERMLENGSWKWASCDNVLTSELNPCALLPSEKRETSVSSATLAPFTWSSGFCRVRVSLLL